MQWAKLVSELIQTHEPERILDLKARKWYFSIYLKDHPNITYYKWKVEDFQFKEKYDLIIAKHVVMYLPKEYVIWKLMTDIYSHLNRNWLCFITYHLPDSYTMTNNPDLYQYCLDDFKWLNGKFIVKDFWNYTNPVSWEINKEHHVEYVVLVRQ